MRNDAASAADTRSLARRTALMLPLAALGGCAWFENLLTTPKTPLPGRREDVMPPQGNLAPVANGPRVTLPPAATGVGSPQPGGTPTHLASHVAAADRLSLAWTADIGEGAGYRRRVTAEPVVAGGRVYTMDSNGYIDAFDASNGRRLWRFDVKAKHDRSINVGGGIAYDGGTLYASTGLGETLAIDAGDGRLRWRAPLDAPARSSPTVADGRVFVITIENKLLAVATADGKSLWSFQAAQSATSVLGEPAPAVANGIVVAGFGSGDLVALRAATGAVIWTDSIAAASGRNLLGNLSAITAMPVIDGERVLVIGLGGLLVALDLRAGRRLWEREVAGGQTPCVIGDWLFAISSGQRLIAFNVLDGHVAWITDLPRYVNEKKQRNPIEWMGPALIADRLVVAGTHDAALAVSPYSGAILGRQKLDSPAAIAPVAADGTLYLITRDGSLLAFR